MGRAKNRKRGKQIKGTGLRAGDYGEMWTTIEESAVFMSLAPGDMAKEPNKSVVPLLQFAFALFLDKPIILMSPEGQDLPPKVRRVADEIIEITAEDWAARKFGPVTEERLRHAMAKIGMRYGIDSLAKFMPEGWVN